MIRVTDIKILPDDSNNVCQISAFADTKGEVLPNADFVGMPEGATMAIGSSVITAAGEMAFLKSDNTFNWV